MENKVYYNNYYYTLEEILDMYKKLEQEQKKDFRDTLAHYSLVQILEKANYDVRMIEGVLDLAGIEAAIINMYGSDCGTPILALRGLYKRNLRKLINLTGKLVSVNDQRIDKFINGEWLLSNLVCQTIGSNFEKVVVDDLFLIDYNSLSEDECLAISDNFVRDMRDEEIIAYDKFRKLKK